MSGPVLPYIPGFGEQLAPYLDQSTDTLSKALIKRAENSHKSALADKDKKIWGHINSGDITDQQKIESFAELSDEGKKTYAPLFTPFVKEVAKGNTERAEKGKKTQAVLSTAEEMKKYLPYTGRTDIPLTSSFNATPDGLNRSGLQKRNYFDELAAAGASFFRDLETKGQLPQGLYEQLIKPRLPNSELSERENLGRIEGLEFLAKQYGGEPLAAPKSSQGSSRLQKVQKGTKLTDEMAEKLYDQAGQDPKEARKLAIGLGYEL